MAITPDRPDVFVLPAMSAATSTTQDILCILPPDGRDDPAAIIESHRRARAQRSRQDTAGCLVPLSVGLVAAGLCLAALGALAASTFPRSARLLVAVVVFLVVSSAVAVLVDRRRRRQPPVQALPVTPIDPRVARLAPGDLPAAEVIRASAVLQALDRARADLRKGEHDADLTDAQRTVSPGDRSTWFFRPEDLAGLRAAATSARDDAAEALRSAGIPLEALED
ncbi:hypothetical protein NYS50_13100 [Curtobacterium flaccumfaciens pv. flaccumfaciens]|uniref:hypothetical protein n=1 Tax=Curtobacterium flaccumfaciens TaxID=2035 RepID=UPI00217DC8B1|nr:hypothetical protein [Curtobacterium flaccumfaciens]MCS6548818.1 hypothetical protein [Curtobacterium flaccumfaciens pv. flaccumfaciens]